MQEKSELRNQFRFLNFKGKVQLGGGADVELWILIDHIALQRPTSSCTSSSYSSSSSSAMIVDSSMDSSSAMLISPENPIDHATNSDNVRNDANITNEGIFPAVPSYLCRLLSKGGMKEELKKYDLKKRLYLGPTSLDPLLAILMSNMAHVQRSQLVFDPFVGIISAITSVYCVCLNFYDDYCLLCLFSSQFLWRYLLTASTTFISQLLPSLSSL